MKKEIRNTIFNMNGQEEMIKDSEFYFPVVELSCQEPPPLPLAGDRAEYDEGPQSRALFNGCFQPFWDFARTVSWILRPKRTSRLIARFLCS